MEKAVQYYILLENDKVVGYERVITENIDLANDKWDLKPIKHDSKVKLSTPPMGLNRMKRARLPS